MNDTGLCQCGCGQQVKKTRQDDPSRGYKKGDNRHYIRGHLRRNNGRTTHSEGYVLVMQWGHHKANPRGYVYEHVLVMETKIGRELGPLEVVHHKDGNPSNNSPDNLHLCKDHLEHMKIHAEAKAVAACGVKDWRPCRFCKKYDDISNMYAHPTNYSFHHNKCAAEYARKFRAKNKEK
jgi:hypothetical protein